MINPCRLLLSRNKRTARYLHKFCTTKKLFLLETRSSNVTRNISSFPIFDVHAMNHSEKLCKETNEGIRKLYILLDIRSSNKQAIIDQEKSEKRAINEV